jgi:hypothetical protein
MSARSIRNHVRVFAAMAIAVPAAVLIVAPASAQVRATPMTTSGTGPRVTPAYRAAQTGFPEAANAARATSARRNAVIIITPLAIVLGVLLIVLLL